MARVHRRSMLKAALALPGGAIASGSLSAMEQGAALGWEASLHRAGHLHSHRGSDEMFPVRRIYCIGRNYAAHSREMGSDPTREPPFFFQKPTDAIQHVPAGTVANHPYPTLTKNYHYEAELVAA